MPSDYEWCTHEFIERLRSKVDQDAWQFLLNNISFDLSKQAQSGGLNGKEVEDVLQQTFLNAYQGIGKFIIQDNNPRKFVSWLRTILGNEINKSYSVKPTVSLDEQEDEQGLVLCDTTNLEADHIRIETIREVLQHLSERDRDMFIYKFGWNLDRDDLASKFKVKEGTITRTIVRIKQKVKVFAEVNKIDNEK